MKATRLKTKHRFYKPTEVGIIDMHMKSYPNKSVLSLAKVIAPQLNRSLGSVQGKIYEILKLKRMRELAAKSNDLPVGDVVDTIAQPVNVQESMDMPVFSMETPGVKRIVLYSDRLEVFF
jgi:hypothetical protein